MPSDKSSGLPRVCPECGGDRWKARRAQADLEAARRLEARADDVARANGLLRFQLASAEAEANERHSYLSRKVVRQARAIKRLEAKLRERGVAPYAGAGLDETSTGAEYDAAGESR